MQCRTTPAHRCSATNLGGVRTVAEKSESLRTLEASEIHLTFLGLLTSPIERAQISSVRLAAATSSRRRADENSRETEKKHHQNRDGKTNGTGAERLAGEPERQESPKRADTAAKSAGCVDAAAGHANGWGSERPPESRCRSKKCWVRSVAERRKGASRGTFTACWWRAPRQRANAGA